jgi:hypothetical protein
MPALALFVIGLTFMGLSIHTARDTAATPIKIKGEAEAPDKKVTVILKSEWQVPVEGRQVAQVIRPQLDVLTLVISAPGYSPFCQGYFKQDVGKLIDFGTVQLVRAVPKIEEKPENIAPLSDGVTPPPRSSSGLLF